MLNSVTKHKFKVSIVSLALVSSIGMAHAIDLEVYGVAHGSFDAVDDGQSTDPHIASNSSRLGFKGSHDLDSSDLKIIFQWEQGVDLTGQGGNDGNGGPGNGSGGLFTNTRDAWVGLAGNFGAIKIGRVGGLNQWVYDYNLFADQVGDLGNIWGGSGLAGRVSNTISYDTPEMGNFSGTFVYKPGEGVDNTSLTTVKGNFHLDHLKFGVGYINQGTGGSTDQKALAITASYSTDKFSIGGGYQNESDRAGISGNDGDSFSFGGSINVGGGVFKAQFTNFNADAALSDSSQFSIGYDYDLGGATIYAAYAATKNDANVAYTANNYGHGDAVVPAFGQDPSVFSVGIIYNFNAVFK